MTDHPTTILAVVGDEETSDPVVRRATELGFEPATRVVLYDVDAKASFLESPLPTEFASEGPDRGAPPLLTADDLEAAGQAPLAGRVRSLSEAGIDAYGWLPATDKLDDLVEYARSIGATRVLASTELDPSPADLEERGFQVETVASGPTR